MMYILETNIKKRLKICWQVFVILLSISLVLVLALSIVSIFIFRHYKVVVLDENWKTTTCVDKKGRKYLRTSREIVKKGSLRFRKNCKYCSTSLINFSSFASSYGHQLPEVTINTTALLAWECGLMY